MNATTLTQTEEFDAAELGEILREMRENLGHDLETVSADLRIRLVYLEAIETGRLEDLPGNVYVGGFCAPIPIILVSTARNCPSVQDGGSWDQ